MKKFVIAAVMVFASSTAFAGDSDALKNILKSKAYAEAESLLKSSLGQLADNAEKARAYNHLVGLALEKFTKEQNVQTANAMAELNKTKVEQFDTLGMYNAAYNAVINGIECEKYDQMPDAKGKVKPKFHEANAQKVANARLTLVNAGNDAAGKGDQDGVLKFWGTFLDTEDTPLLAAIDKSNEKGFLGQVAYYAGLYANQAKQFDRANKYFDMAMQDPDFAKDAQNQKFSMAQRNLKTREDSLNYVNQLKELYQKEPDNEMAFGTLCNMYSGLNMATEFNQLVNDKISADPNNATAWALKGQMEMNTANVAGDNADWDSPIASFKKSIEIDGTNPIVLTYLGFCMNSKAATLNDRNAQKEIYKESLSHLERAKDIDPDRQKANWAYPLYQCYYLVYSANDPRTQELEQLLKK